MDLVDSVIHRERLNQVAGIILKVLRGNGAELQDPKGKKLQILKAKNFLTHVGIHDINM